MNRIELLPIGQRRFLSLGAGRVMSVAANVHITIEYVECDKEHILFTVPENDTVHVAFGGEEPASFIITRDGSAVHLEEVDDTI